MILNTKYDPFGRRILKISKPCTSGTPQANTTWTYTYYVNDASGNVMATYTYDKETTENYFHLNENMIYGSSRLGLRNRDKHLSTFTISGSVLTHEDADPTERATGTKRYEYTNHLGNVLLITTDRKMSVDANSNGTTDYYHAVVDAYYDYGPFGNVLDGRTYGTGYRYGMNGQEHEDEITNTHGAIYSAEYWMYDTRLGRRWNIDPVIKPWESPYACFNNNPILFSDPKGLDGKKGSENATNDEGDKRMNCGNEEIYTCSSMNPDGTLNNDAGWVNSSDYVHSDKRQNENHFNSYNLPGGLGETYLPKGAKAKTYGSDNLNLKGSQVKADQKAGDLKSFTVDEVEYTAKYSTKNGEFLGFKDANNNDYAFDAVYGDEEEQTDWSGFRGPVLILAGADIIKKRFVTAGTSQLTSIASSTLGKLNIKIPGVRIPSINMAGRIVWTPLISRGIARWIPYVGWALLAYDFTVYSFENPRPWVPRMCFVAGTKIAMGDGSTKNIEDVKVGDLIVSYNLESDSLEIDEVLRVDNPNHDDMVEFNFINGVININTFDHPYYVVGKGWCSYKPDFTKERYNLTCGQLEVGDICLYNNSGQIQEIKLTSINERIGKVQTYNLSHVKKNSNFFANGFLVHNELK